MLPSLAPTTYCAPASCTSCSPARLSKQNVQTLRHGQRTTNLQQQAKPWPNKCWAWLDLTDWLYACVSVVDAGMLGGAWSTQLACLPAMPAMPVLVACTTATYAFSVGASYQTVRLARTRTPGRIRLEAAKQTGHVRLSALASFSYGFGL